MGDFAGGDDRRRLHGSLRAARQEREFACPRDRPHVAETLASRRPLSHKTPAQRPVEIAHRIAFGPSGGRRRGSQDAALLPLWRHGQYGVADGIQRTSYEYILNWLTRFSHLAKLYIYISLFF